MSEGGLFARLFRGRPAAAAAAASSDAPHHPGVYDATIAPADLLVERSVAVRRLRQEIGLPPALETSYVDPLLARACVYFHLLPASEVSHHAHPGGLLDHSLEVAHLALGGIKSSLLRVPGDTHDDRVVLDARWRIAALLGAILHDAGKLVQAMRVVDAEGRAPARDLVWRPLEESLWAWVRRCGIRRYRVEWIGGRGSYDHTREGVHFLAIFLDPSLRAWLAARGGTVLLAVESYLVGRQAVRGHAHAEYRRILEEADHESARRGVAAVSTSVQGGLSEHLRAAVRRALTEARPWNGPAALVHTAERTLYLRWPEGAEALGRAIVEARLSLDRTPGALLTTLRALGFVDPGEGGDEGLVAIVPEGGGHKIACVPLQAEIVFPDLVPLAARVRGAGAGGGPAEIVIPGTGPAGTDGRDRPVSAGDTAAPEGGGEAAGTGVSATDGEAVVPASSPARAGGLEAEIRRRIGDGPGTDALLAILEAVGDGRLDPRVIVRGQTTIGIALPQGYPPQIPLPQAKAAVRKITDGTQRKGGVTNPFGSGWVVWIRADVGAYLLRRLPEILTSGGATREAVPAEAVPAAAVPGPLAEAGGPPLAETPAAGPEGPQRPADLFASPSAPAAEGGDGGEVSSAAEEERRAETGSAGGPEGTPSPSGADVEAARAFLRHVVATRGREAESRNAIRLVYAAEAIDRWCAGRRGAEPSAMLEALLALGALGTAERAVVLPRRILVENGWPESLRLDAGAEGEKVRNDARPQT